MNCDQLQLGMGLRDEGIETVVENSRSWQDMALDIVKSMPDGELMGEDIHRKVQAAIGEPHHPNAYGALIMKAIRADFLAKTGAYKKSSRPSAHARVNPVYKKAINNLIPARAVTCRIDITDATSRVNCRCK